MKIYNTGTQCDAKMWKIFFVCSKQRTRMNCSSGLTGHRLQDYRGIRAGRALEYVPGKKIGT